MVRLAAAVAINSTATAADQQVAETDETQEKRIQEAYTDACKLLNAGDTAEAQVSQVSCSVRICLSAAGAAC